MLEFQAGPDLVQLFQFSAQWFELAAVVAVFIAVNTWFGWGISKACLPSWYRERCWSLAPIVGIAFQIVLLAPLSYFGLPVSQTVPALLTASLLTNVASAAHLWRTGRLTGKVGNLRERLLASLPWIFLFGGLTFLSAVLVTGVGTGSARDIWGSGDFHCNWAVMEYLWNTGGNLSSYLAQDVFVCAETELHLTIWARLGSIAYIAWLSGWLFPEESFRAMNPAIVMGMWNALTLAVSLLERRGVRGAGAWAVLACHPFLYFLLYFSYYSQALAIPLVVLTILTAHAGIQDSRRLGDLAALIAPTLLLTATLLSYPGAGPVMALFYLGLAAMAWRRQLGRPAWGFLICHLGLVFSLSFYYLPHTINELLFVAGQVRMPGWNWQSLIGAGEFLGSHSVLGYDLPVPTSLFPRLLREITLITAGGALFALGCRQRKDNWFYALLGATTIALAAVALRKVSLRVENANHAFVKILSQYAIFLLIPVLAGLDSLSRRGSRGRRVAIKLIVALWVIAELGALAVGTQQEAWYTADLVKLVRRNLHAEQKVVILPHRLRWRSYEATVLVRDERVLLDLSAQVAQASAARWPDALFFVDGSYAPPEPILDSEGPYRAGPPPHELDLNTPSGRAWLVSQRSAILSSRDGRPLMATIGALSETLVVDYEAASSGAGEAVSCSIDVNGRWLGRFPLNRSGGRLWIELNDQSPVSRTYDLVRLTLEPTRPRSGTTGRPSRWKISSIGSNARPKPPGYDPPPDLE